MTNLAPNGKPKPAVELSGRDGERMAIVGAALAAMRKASWTQEERNSYIEGVKAGDYDHMILVTWRYCEVY